MIRMLSIALLVMLGASSAAQRSFLPVKVNHKWTFLDVSNTVKVDTSRQYDYMGDIMLPWLGKPGSTSGYYLIENNELLGLVNASFNPVLPAAWKEIQPISPELFLVSDGQYTIIDAAGTDLLDQSRYEAINIVQEVDYGFFLVKKNGKWGVQKKGQQHLSIPVEYPQIEYLNVDGGLFKIKQAVIDTAWMVIDWQQNPLPKLSAPQLAIRPASFKYLLTRQSITTRWTIRDLTGAEKLKLDPGAVLAPLNHNTLFAYQKWRDAPYTVLVLDDHIDTLAYEFDTIQAVDRDLALYQLGKQSGLILANGDLLVLDTLNKLEFIDSDEDLFRIICTSKETSASKKWGLFSKSAQKICMPCQYDSIGIFYGNLARCYLDGQVGLINKSPAEIIPPRYEEIPDIEEGISRIQGYWKDSTMVYRVTEDGQIDGEPYADRYVPVIGKGLFYGLNFDYQNEVNGSSPRGRSSTEGEDDDRPYLQYAAGDGQPDTIWQNEDKFVVVTQEEYQVVERKTKTRTRRNYIKPSFFQRMFPFLFNKRKKYDKEEITSERWEVTYATSGMLRECTDVNWTLLYHDRRLDNIVANEFTSLEKKRKVRARKISIFLNGSQPIPDFHVLGIRLSDFRKGLPYAAFLDLQGRMGLIDKAGNQAKGANGQPLRFTYIGKPSEEKIPAITASSSIRKSYSESLYNEVLRDFFVSRVPMNWDNRVKTTQTGDAQWGFIDASGQTLIPFAYEMVWSFVDSFAMAKLGGKLGVINTRNEVIIPFLYDNIVDKQDHWVVSNTFLGQPSLLYDLKGRPLPDIKSAQLATRGETLFPHRSNSQLFGYVDINGTEKIPPHYLEAGHFSEDLAAVKKEDTWGFINRNGQPIFRIDSSIKNIQQVFEFSEGRCAIQQITDEKTGQKGNRKIGFIDTVGQLVITPAYHRARSFQNGHAIVAILDFENYVPSTRNIPGEYGMINRQGQRIVPIEYEVIFPMNTSGLSVVFSKDSVINRGVISRDSGLISNGFHSNAKVFEDGFATFNGFEWTVMDLHGKPIPLPFDDVADINYFKDGHLMVQNSKEKWSHLYYDGKEPRTITADLDFAQPFKNNYALVKYSGKSYLYHKDKHWLAPPASNRITSWSGDLIGMDGRSYYNIGLQNVFHRSFRNASVFKGEVASVRLKGGYGVINRNGMFVIPPKFRTITIKNDYIEVKPLPEKFGLIDKTGKTLVPAEFDKIIYLDNGIIRVEQAEQIGYYHRDGRLIWAPEGVWW